LEIGIDRNFVSIGIYILFGVVRRRLMQYVDAQGRLWMEQGDHD
jgi:hypothetical protein